MAHISPTSRERIHTSQLVITLPPNNVITTPPEQDSRPRKLAERSAVQHEPVLAPRLAQSTPDTRPWVRREPGLALASAGAILMGAAFAIPETLREQTVYGAGALTLLGAVLVFLKGAGPGK
jgi:hypothetical protein